MRETKTVKELIEAFQALVKERPEIENYAVLHEGCDCDGSWDGRINVAVKEKQILINRFPDA